MIKALSQGSRRVLALTLVSAIGFGAAGTASAQGGMAEVRALPVMVSSAAGIGTARFDWLAKRVTASKTTAEQPGKRTRAVIAGRGSYICSPAGFGRKSRCSSAR